MKIRTGFVSNSSASSFLIYGCEISMERDLFEDILEKCQEEHKWFKNIEFNNCDGCQEGWIGRSYSTLEDDENGLQFKEKTKALIVRFCEKYNEEIEREKKGFDKEVIEENEEENEENCDISYLDQEPIKIADLVFDVYEEAWNG